MSGPRLGALVALGALLAGCPGRLQFDPRLLDAAPGGLRLGSGGSDLAAAPRPVDAGAPAPASSISGGDYGEAPPPAADARAPADAEPAADADVGGLPPASADAGGARDDAGSADDDAAAAGCPAGFDVLDTVFKKRCGACHGAASPSRNLDLVSPGLGARLVGKASTCGGQPLIAASGRPPSGLLFDKLAGAVAGCGVQMPAGAAPLAPIERQCVSEWAVQAINQATGRIQP
jgi:hypothetical protein